MSRTATLFPSAAAPQGAPGMRALIRLLVAAALLSGLVGLVAGLVVERLLGAVAVPGALPTPAVATSFAATAVRPTTATAAAENTSVPDASAALRGREAAFEAPVPTF